MTPNEKSVEFYEYPGEEALHHIRTMYPGLWDCFSQSAKRSLKNHINNNFNAALLSEREKVKRYEKALKEISEAEDGKKKYNNGILTRNDMRLVAKQALSPATEEGKA